MRFYIHLCILAIVCPILCFCNQVNGACLVANANELAKNIRNLNLSERIMPLCVEYSGNKTVDKEKCQALSGNDMEKCPTDKRKFTCKHSEEVTIILYEGWPGCNELNKF